MKTKQAVIGILVILVLAGAGLYIYKNYFYKICGIADLCYSKKNSNSNSLTLNQLLDLLWSKV